MTISGGYPRTAERVKDTTVPIGTDATHPALKGQEDDAYRRSWRVRCSFPAAQAMCPIMDP